MTDNEVFVLHKHKAPTQRGAHKIFLLRRLLYHKVKRINPNGERVRVLVSRRGADIGDGVHFGHKAIVKAFARIGDGAYLDDHVLVGKSAKVGERAVIRVRSVIGRKAKIGADAHVGHEISVGSRTNIGDGAWIGTGSILGRRTKVLGGIRVPVRAKTETRAVINTDLAEAGMVVKRIKRQRRWQPTPVHQPEL